ncbi:hypothetical protein GCM10010172_47830 [Paractinoplanes ferrugineus]|uniref:Uncharacterized protein n=1 Tax=Paractinoplanes ferrugineus TaxID=113564 RepID=A0A919MDX7_9ACTN|nr:hypothetical protein [Actinoplanes ferrugineus]GIE11044.1 hypothetical protein Afe05nite_28840 [Actinoplanes ferrugineus]
MSDAPYGLHPPTVADAHDALHRVHGADGPRIWAALLAGAGVTGQEPDALDRLLPVLDRADEVTQLCAQALRIRLTSYTCLAAAHSMTRS